MYYSITIDRIPNKIMILLSDYFLLEFVLYFDLKVIYDSIDFEIVTIYPQILCIFYGGVLHFPVQKIEL